MSIKRRRGLSLFLIDQLKSVTDEEGKPVFPNFITVRGSGSSELETKVDLAIKEKNINAKNVFMGLTKKNLDGDKFSGFKGRSWIFALDTSANPAGYMPVFESFMLAIIASRGADIGSMKMLYDRIAETPLPPDAIADMVSRRVIVILPRSAPLDPKKLRQIYKNLKMVALAA